MCAVQEAANGADAPEPLEELFEDPFESNAPPEPTLARRAKSYSDFYDIVRAQLHRDGAQKKKRRTRRSKRRDFCSVEALDVPETEALALAHEEPLLDLYTDDLLQASQQKYQCVLDTSPSLYTHPPVLSSSRLSRLTLPGYTMTSLP